MTPETPYLLREIIVPSGLIPTAYSITLNSSSQLQLVNDAASPGATYYYGTNGSGVKGWYTLTVGGTPGGANKAIQFNDGGVFGGDANLTWDTATGDFSALGTGTITLQGDTEIDLTTTGQINLTTDLSTGAINLNGPVAMMTGAYFNIPPSQSGGSGFAPFHFTAGVAPTTNISNGDMWFTSTHLFMRIGGVTYQLDQQTAGGSWLLASGGTLTGANTITGTTSNTLKYVFNSLGVTQTNGAGEWLANTTAAAAGAQQISPSTVWEGQGWKTNATAGSQSVKFASYVLPVQGAATPNAQWLLRSSVNAGGYVTQMSIDTAGNTVLSGNLNIFSVLTATGGAGILQSAGNNTWTFNMNANTLTGAGGIVKITNQNTNYTATAGTLSEFGISGSAFAPTSGTAVYNAIILNNTINQTGGANGNVTLINITPTYTAAGGNVTGFDYNPTVTTITGTHLAWRNTSGNLSWGEGSNLILGTTTGTKFGTTTSQKLAFWNATPIVQLTTAVAAAAFVANTSLIANDSATWDGYTIGQIVKALRNLGLLA